MGRKVLQFSLGLSVLAVTLMAVTCFMDFYRKQWTTAAGFVSVMTMEVYLTKAYVKFAQSELCQLALKIVDDISWCKDQKEGSDLQNVQQRVCSAAARNVVPNLCNGMTGAYAMGIALVIIYICNVLLLATSSWLRYQYMTTSPKKKYRRVAMILDCIGMFVLVAVLAMYIPFVLVPLDSTKVKSPADMFINDSAGMGAGKGFFIAWIIPLIQIILIILSNYAKTADEERYAEAREQQKIREELELSSQIYGGDRPSLQPPVGYAPGQSPYGMSDAAVMPMGGYGMQQPGWNQGYGPQPGGYGQQPGGFGQPQPQPGGYGGGAAW